MSSRFNFYALPPELRTMIYKDVFEDAQLVLHPGDFLGTLTRSERQVLRPMGISKLISYIVDGKAAFFQAFFDFCRRDALSILASHTTIELEEDATNLHRQNLLSLIDPQFLEYITKLRLPTEQIRFLRHNQSLLPRLQGVNTVARMSVVHFPNVLMLKFLRLPPTNPWHIVLHEIFWEGASSRRWGRDEILQLARKRGYVLEFAMHQKTVYKNTTPTETVLRYNMSTGQISSRLVLQKETVILKDGEIDGQDAIDRLRG